MASAKPPKELYVVAKMESKDDPHPFGFLNAYEPSKSAFLSKKRTQDEWAYAWNIQNFKLEQFGPDYFITGSRYDWSSSSGRTQVQIREPIHPDLAPKIWKNDPIRGFVIQKSVSRYSTSNKLWRILDPRGVELEISTGCLETIISNAGILKGGEIDAECQWMSNKNLLVAV